MPAGKHAKMHDSTPDCVTANCGIHPSIPAVNEATPTSQAIDQSVNHEN